jgi:hypothetical protein
LRRQSAVLNSGLRALMRLPLRSVARALGCSHSTLLRCEADTSPLPPAVALAWRLALATAGQEQLRDATRHGLSAMDLFQTELATFIVALKGDTL